MKNIVSIIFLLSYLTTCSISQDKGEMHLVDHKLIGDCDNKYFTGFTIELDTVYSEIDSTRLFDQFPRIGKINFKNSKEIPTEFTLTNRAGYAQIMFRFKSEWHTFDHLTFRGDYVTYTIDSDPEVPCTIEDLKILKLAKTILSEEKYWDHNDDRNCEEDLAKKRYSLYCALKISSLEIERKYNHRNAVLQKVRHLIQEKYPEKKWNHRLLDFNNMEEIAYADIIELLTEIEQIFEQELKERKPLK